MSGVGAYFQLTKPRLLPLVLLSGLPALVMAAGGWPAPEVTLGILGGTALAAGAANALNSYLERDLDAKMARTRSRPLPSGALDPRRALVFGLVLGVLGPGVLLLTSGPAAAGVALAGILFYVFVYTLWLKPRSSVGVIVGGASGAVAPLIADAAIGGSIGAPGWILFGLIFLWQPPHFWAIALYRREEYEAAGFPLLPSEIGDAATRRRIAYWVGALAPLGLAPVALGLLGPFYGLSALALGGWFLVEALLLVRRADAESSRRLFFVSLVYLMGVLVAMIIDLAIQGVSL